MNIQNLQGINGHEIIEYLNTAYKKNKFDLEDTNICLNSFKFNNQKNDNTYYKLYFSVGYNNWGTEQTISDNIITITNRGIKVSMSEPFEGDGTDKKIQGALVYWIDTHKFEENMDEKFEGLLREAYDRLPEISYTDNEGLQNIIDLLKKAQTYQREWSS